MYCPKCGIENTETAKFCKSCGQRLDSVSKSFKGWIIGRLLFLAMMIIGIGVVLGVVFGSRSQNYIASSTKTSTAVYAGSIQADLTMTPAKTITTTVMQPTPNSSKQPTAIPIENMWTRRPLALITGHGYIGEVTYSPTDEILAVGGSNGILLYEYPSLTQVGYLPTESQVERIGFSSDGSILVAVSYSEIVLWDMGSKSRLEPEVSYCPSGEYNKWAMDISPNGDLLAIACYPNPDTLIISNIKTGKKLHELKHADNFLISATFSSNGELLAVAHEEGVTTWNVYEGQRLYEIESYFPGGEAHEVIFSADGSLLVVEDARVKFNSDFEYESIESIVTIWDVSTGAQINTMGMISDSSVGSKHPPTFSLSPNGKMLARVYGGTITLWDILTGESLGVLEHSDIVNSVAFSPNGLELASGLSNKNVIIWNLETNEIMSTINEGGDIRPISSLAFSPTEEILATGLGMPLQILSSPVIVEIEAVVEKDDEISSAPRQVIFWDLNTGKRLGSLRTETTGITCVEFSPDGQMLASGMQEGAVILWDVNTKTRLGLLEGHEDYVSSVAFSSDGEVLASGGWDGNVIIWNSRTEQTLKILESRSVVTSIAFSQDGNMLASGYEDNKVILWDVNSGEQIFTKSHSESVLSLVFSPNGEFLASSSFNAIDLWDVNTGERVAEHDIYGYANIDFSPNGNLLAYPNYGKVVVIEANTGEQIAVLNVEENVYTEELSSISFSPDGRFIAVGTGPYLSTVVLWRIDN